MAIPVEFYTNKMRITNNVEIKSITINKYCITDPSEYLQVPDL